MSGAGWGVVGPDFLDWLGRRRETEIPPVPTIAELLARRRAEREAALVQRPDVTAVPHADFGRPRDLPPVIRAATREPSLQAYETAQATALETDAARREDALANTGDAQRLALATVRPLMRLVNLPAELAGVEAPYGRALRREAEITREFPDLHGEPSPLTHAAGEFIGTLPAFGVGAAATGPIARALATRLAGRGMLGGAARGLLTTSGTLGTGAALSEAGRAAGEGRPLPEVGSRALEAGLEASLPTSPLNATLLAVGAGLGTLGPLAERLTKARTIAERLAAVRAARESRLRTQVPLPGARPVEAPAYVRRPPVETPERAAAREAAEARRAAGLTALGEQIRAAPLPGEPRPPASLLRSERGAVGVRPPPPEGSYPAPLTPEGPPDFYSRALRALDQAPFEKGTAAQWRAVLAKGVNQAELKDTGLAAYLDARPEGSLARADVQAAAQPVRVQETQFGGDRPDQLVRIAQLTELREHWRDEFQNAVAERRNAEPARQAFDAVQAQLHRAEQATPEPRYHEYTLPGGENYREIVLSTPGPAVGATPTELETALRQLGWQGEHAFETALAVTNGSRTIRHQAMDAIRADLQRRGGPVETHPAYRLAEEVERLATSAPGYVSGHWPGIENPVGHLRLTDRTLGDGRKATFVEEFQSDVHEAGREGGYQDPARQESIQRDLEELRRRTEAGLASLEGRPEWEDTVEGDITPNHTERRLIALRDNPQARQDSRELAGELLADRERYRTLRENERQGQHGVPRLPFSRTGDWAGLLVRRALAEAVRSGSDALAWTTGTQQAERYSQTLQRGLDAIRWKADGSHLEFRRPGREWEPYGMVHGHDLPGIVGRDIAERLRREPVSTHGWRTVSGTDLVVGGAGMRTFYDEIVPRVVTDYLKKIGVKDVKPEQVPLEGTTARIPRPDRAEVTVPDIERAVTELRRVGHDDVADLAEQVYGRLGESGESQFTLAQLRIMMAAESRSAMDWRTFTDALRTEGPSTKVWSLPITPELKAKIQSGEGLYLYGGLPLDPRLLKAASPVALGAVTGAVAGSTADQEHPVRSALIGAGLGALGGGAISKALRARHGVATTGRPLPEGGRGGRITGALEDELSLGALRRHAQGPPLEPTARQPGGLPVEPPIEPSEHVNLAKFDLDPTGVTRLRAETERIVDQMGLSPKTPVTWTELRRTASQLGVDFTEGNRPTSTRASGAEMLAVRNIVSANVAELERVSGQLARTDLTTPERATLEQRLGAIEQQNAHLLDRFIRSRTQAGRDLNSLKIVANRNLDPAYWWTKARQFKGADLTADEQVEIRRLGESRDRAGLVKYVSGLRTVGTDEKLLSLWKAGLLTNPKTHVVNILGNTVFALLETAKDPVAALNDRLLELFTGQRTKGGLNALTARASLKGVRDGLAEARGILRGEPVAGRKLEFSRQVHYDNVVLDTYVKTVFNLLEAADRPFYHAALQRSLVEQATVAGRQMGLRGVALRDYVTGIQRGEGPLADDLVTRAISDANYATFKDETRMGRVARAFAQDFPGGQVILPFQKTPAAVATRVLEYSPLGALRGLKNAVEVGLKGKGASPALQRAASEQLARGLVGSGAIWLGYQLAKHDLMTGAAPTFGSHERQRWLQENRQANSLWVNGQWWNIGRLSPAGNLLALGANLYRAAQQPGANDLAVKLLNVGAGALKTVADQPFVTGVSQAMDALQQPDREMARFAQGLAGSAVPAVAGAVARGTDVPRIPEYGTGPTSVVGGAVMERVPGLRKLLPPKISTLGARLPETGLANALFNPATASPDLRRDPLIAELADADYAVPRLARGRGEDARTYSARSRLYGAAARQVLTATVQSDEYAAARAREQDALALAATLRRDPAFRTYPPEQLAQAILAQQRKADPDAKTRAEVLAEAVAAARRQLKATLQ